MACGCGGSSSSARTAPREIIRQDKPTPRPPVQYGDPGFTWNGPQRPAPAPTPAAEPEPTR